MSSQFKEKIWIRGTNWVGDCILTLPALEALRSAHPEAEIVLTVRPWVSEIFECCPAIDRVMIYDREGEHRSTAGRSRFIREVARESFDLAVLLPNSFESAWLAWRAGIPKRVGYATDGRSLLLTHRARVREEILGQHQVYYYLDLLLHCGLIHESPDPRHIALEVSEARMSQARERLARLGIPPDRSLMGLNPGAFFGSAKRWPSDRYATLADRVIDALGVDVLIFGSANEHEMAMDIAQAMHHTPRILCGETTLAELAALLRCCSLLVTNDSGPMHLSAAVSTRTVAIFGPTDEVATSPLGMHTRIVKHPVSCSPCLLRVCPIDHRCMSRISVEDVYRAVMELLSQ